jgi:DNA mismatch endonuclease (patch repair protein)
MTTARRRPAQVTLGSHVVDYPTPSTEMASYVMRRNPGHDSSPELAVRRALHARGLRYRLHRRIVLPGGAVRPDIVFSGARVAVFVDGCFGMPVPIMGRVRGRIRGTGT